MNIKHVAGVGLAPRRLPGQQRDFPMRCGVFCHVVDDDQSMLAAIAEIFRHGEAGERREPLQAGSGRGARDDEDAAFWSAMSLNGVDDPFDRRGLLTDRNVDTNNVAGLLIDDAVDRNRRLADGAIPDNQLALAAPQGKHGIDDEQTGLHGFADEIAVDDCGRRSLHGVVAFGIDDRAPVERTAKWIDDATEQGRPHRHAHHFAAVVDAVARLDSLGDCRAAHSRERRGRA